MSQLDYFKNGGLSIPTFIATCFNIADFAERDLLLLQPFGITLPKIENLRSMATDLTDTKSNQILQAQKKVKTKNKDNYFKYFIDKLDIIKTQFAGVFNQSNALYDTLFAKSHSVMKTKDFLTHVNDILQVLKENREALVVCNFGDAEISAFESDIETLTRLEKEKDQAEISFNNDTFARSEARRATYELLYNISSMGRVYWKRKNPAISQDYIITHKSKKKKATSTEETNSNTVEFEIDTTTTANNLPETPTNTGEETTGSPIT